MSSTTTDTETTLQRPQAAQIPLNSFTLPTFPPKAGSLKSLTLSCDIPLSEYPGLLERAQNFNIALPNSIDSLTLELFSFGYPAGFLAALADNLPSLRALTVYAQLFAGTTPESRADAVHFFDKVGKNLRELCLVDAFSEKGFWGEVAWGIGNGIGFLEVTYSYRHGDGLKGVYGEELVGLVGRDTVACVLGLMKPGEGEQESGVEETEKEEVEDGILPFPDAVVLVEKLTGPKKPTGLAMLDATMFKLTLEQLQRILKENTGLRVLNVTLEMDADGLPSGDLGDCAGLEALEIVLWPSSEMVEDAKQEKETGISRKHVVEIGDRYPKLTTIKASILRTKEVAWNKVDGEWVKA